MNAKNVSNVAKIQINIPFGLLYRRLGLASLTGDILLKAIKSR